jgi:hypothetical protein
MPKQTPKARLAAAALKLLARQSWSELTLAATAKAAKIPFAELAPIARAKPALIGIVLDLVGGETAARYKPDSDAESARDRLFDVAMLWFDLWGPRKAALRALYDGLKRDPLALIAARGDILAAASWLLALAEADTGSASAFKAAGLAGALARAIPVWLDDGKDLAKTMARLDGDLRRGESVFGRRTGNAAN